MGCCFGSFASLQSPKKKTGGGVTVRGEDDVRTPTLATAPDNMWGVTDPTHVETTSHDGGERDGVEMTRAHIRKQLHGRVGANMDGSFKLHRPAALVIYNNSMVK